MTWSDLSDETKAHIEEKALEMMESGVPEAEAWDSARREFGNVTQTIESGREVWFGLWVEQLCQDFLFGLRLLKRTPLWTTIVGAVLALGIGLTTVIFSIVYSVLLQPLPYANPNQLVSLWTSYAQGNARGSVVAANWNDWRQQSQLFEDMALIRGANFNLTGSGTPERLRAARTTANLPSILGVRPLVGRAFTNEEVAEETPVVLLSYAVWQRGFGGDRSILGRKLLLSGVPHEVVGVMPPDYQFPTPDEDIWTPIAPIPADELQARVQGQYRAVGRLKPGVTPEQAQQELSVISRRLEQQYPLSNKGVGATVQPLLDDTVGRVRGSLNLLMASCAGLLLIGCANLSVLLLSRTTARSRELAVRVALGASLSRIRRQILMEILPLAALGTLTGTSLAALLLRTSDRWIPDYLPRAQAIGMHWPVLVFSALVSCATVLAAALWPAGAVSRLSSEAFRARGASDSGRSRSLLVAAQVATATVLIFGCTLLVKSLTEALHADKGFDLDHVLTMHFAVSRSKYPAPNQVAAYEQRLVTRIESIPGVKSAAFINRLPFTGDNQSLSMQFEGDSDHVYNSDSRAITPRFFETMRIPLRSGRPFSDTDTADSTRAVIVDERFVQQANLSGTPLGRRIRFAAGNVTGPWIEIVGVVQSTRNNAEDGFSPHIYLPVTQRLQDRGALVIRTEGDSAAMTSAVLAQIRAEDPDQPVYDIRTLNDWLDRVLETRNLLTSLTAGFAGAALFLASLGLFGAVSYATGLRTREFGIRLALGAARSNVIAIVLWQAGTVVLAGLCVGTLLAWPAALAIRSQLFRVTPFDPAAFGVVLALLLVVCAGAAYLPARRAARIDPASALRVE